MLCCESHCQPSHLKIVFPVHDEPVAEHVPHDDEVGVLALHAHAVHAEKLREERAAMTLHYVLQESRETINNQRTVSYNKLVTITDKQIYSRGVETDVV